MYLRTNSRFKKVVPNFNIANATIHFDELSPYLHIVSVPFKDGLKNGIEKHKKQLNELNNKAESLQNKPNEISDIINNLKPTMINKNNYMINVYYNSIFGFSDNWIWYDKLGIRHIRSVSNKKWLCEKLDGIQSKNKIKKI